jgi:hypothetical protein
VINSLFSVLQQVAKEHLGYLIGFFNVESGEVSISDERFLCDSCWTDREISVVCTTCEKDGTNFIKMRSGAGDGIYSLFRFFEVEKPANSIGGMLILDYVLNAELIMPYQLNQNGLRINNLDFSKVKIDCAGEFIGQVVCKNLEDQEADAKYEEMLKEIDPFYVGSMKANRFCLYVGDAAANNDGSFALLNVGVTPGLYNVYLFGDIAIYLREDVASDFQLPSKSKLSKEDLNKYVLGDPNDDVRAHIKTIGLETAHWNYLLEANSVLPKTLYALPESTQAAALEPSFVANLWSAQLAHKGDIEAKERLTKFFSHLSKNEFTSLYRDFLEMRGISI